jgi:DNA-binding CsgD family transcriptional regulator
MLRGDLRSAPGEPLFVPTTLQQLIQDRLEELSPAARDALFVAAAVNDPSVDLLVRASDPSADVAGSLAAAETAGVVDVSDGRVTFSHPLFASTLYHAVPPARRRAIHARLGQLVAATDERALHLALGASGPDPVVAAALDDAAHAAAARGAPDAAAELHERAHELTPSSDHDARTRRQVEAAECYFAAGDLERAQHLLEAEIGAQPAGPGRASVLRRLAKVRYRRDSCSVAAELLTRALDEVGADASLRALVERDLAWSVMQCGDMRDAAAHIRSALERSRATADETMLRELIAANAMAEFLLGNEVPAESMHPGTGLGESATDTPIEWRPSMMLAMRLKWSGDIEEARLRLDGLRQHAIEEGDETSLPFVLAQMSEAATLAGEFGRAVRYADEAKRLATQTGQEPIRALAMYAEALAKVHLGHMDEARAAGQSALELAERAGSIVTMMLAQSVLGFADLSVDDAPAAKSQLAPLVAWLDIVGIRHPGALWFIPEEVEALIGTGDLERADRLLAGYEADAVRLGLSWSLLAAARARALLTAAQGDARGAGETLDAVLRKHGGKVPPFQRARALYVLGTIRRRTRQRKSARESLEAALEMFEALGAQTWSAKARRMLGRADGVTRKQEEAALTPAERRVAQLVAAGATNREVASRLFVSVRAVELHLTSIYRKLEIRSRTELAVRLAATTAEPTDAEGPTSAGEQEPAAVVAG